MNLSKEFFEWLFVGLFLVGLGYVGMGEMLDHQLVHSSPYGLFASDAFGEVAFAEGVVDIGSYKTIPGYIRAGFDDTVGFHMPIFYHIVANISIAVGIPVWSADVFLALFFSLLVVLMMYLMIREYSRNVAILSLPLSVFMYVGPFKLVYTWGSWDVVLASALMLAGMWALSYIEKPLMWLILGVLSASIALTHITEAFFFGVFAALFTAVRFFRSTLTWQYARSLALSSAFSFIISLYYLIIFKSGYGKGGTDFSFGYQAPGSFDVAFSHFGWAGVLIVIGVAAWMMVIFSKKEEIVLLVAPFMLLMGFSNVISTLAPRAFQTRYFWPVHLSLFLGLFFYLLLKSIIKDWKLWHSMAISVLVVLAIGSQFYQKFGSQGIMDGYHWQLIEWVKSSTQKGDRLLYFYGDIYNQEAVLWLQQRLSYRVDLQNMANAIEERKIKKSYIAEVAAADDAGLMYRKGIFSFGYHYEDEPRERFSGDMDICSFDYWVFDRGGFQQVLAKYNMLLVNELLNKSAEVAFVNEGVVAVRNTNKGGDCIAERNFE